MLLYRIYPHWWLRKLPIWFILNTCQFIQEKHFHIFLFSGIYVCFQGCHCFIPSRNNILVNKWTLRVQYHQLLTFPTPFHLHIIALQQYVLYKLQSVALTFYYKNIKKFCQARLNWLEWYRWVDVITNFYKSIYLFKC
jgi:hypothetical protein